jgi:restriction endonuclease
VTTDLLSSTSDKRIDEHDYATAAPTFLPDILADLQNETDLTRATLVRILQQSGRLADFTVNPQALYDVLAAPSGTCSSE